MNPIDKIRELEKAAPPLTVPVDIEVNGQTHSFLFRKIGFLEKQRIDAIPVTFKRTDQIDDNGNPVIEPSFDIGKAADRDAALISQSLIDENGANVLTPAQVSALHPDVGPKFLAAARRVNGAAKDAIQDAIKNSEATGSVDSSSESPTT